MPYDPRAFAAAAAARSDGYVQAQAPQPSRSFLGQLLDGAARGWHLSTDGAQPLMSAETHAKLEGTPTVKVGPVRVLNPLHYANKVLYSAAEGGYATLNLLWGGMGAVAGAVDGAAQATGVSKALSVQGYDFLPGTLAMQTAEAVPVSPEFAFAHEASAARATARTLRQEAGVGRKVATELPQVKPQRLKPTEPEVTPEHPQASLEQPLPTGAAGAVRDTRAPDSIPEEPPAKAAPEAAHMDAEGLPNDHILHGPDAPVLTPEELLGDPEKARATITERLGTLTPEQAGEIAGRVEKAMQEGTVVDDPFFRSLLHVQLDPTDHSKSLQVLQIFDDSLQDMAAKAGAGHRTIESMKAELSDMMARGVTMEDLAKNAEDTHTLAARARLGVHAMVKAGYDFVQARDELLPRIIAKEPGARESLVDALVRSSQMYALGKAPLSNAGRAMRFAQEDIGLGIGHVADDLLDIEDPAAIERRVRDSVDELSDDDLAELTGHIKTAKDLERVDQILGDPNNAQRYGLIRRAAKTLSVWLRSNALSPATGLFNAASFVIHDAFRAEASRTWAIRQAIREGRLDDAELFSLERAVGRSVYWKAHLAGVNAMAKRLKWEALGDLEDISKVAGFDGVSEKARLKRGTMLENGYVPPSLREWQKSPTLAITGKDADAFNARLSDRALEGGSLARVLNGIERVGATADNVVHALAGASMKVFINSIDDAGRAFVQLKELHMQSARFAFREGVAQGLEGEALANYVKNRSVELAELPPASVMDAMEEALFSGGELSDQTKFLLQRDRMVDDEVDKVMFMDGPQTALAKKTAQALELDRLGIVFPFVRTPTRLLEAGLVDYTPWAGTAQHIRAQLLAGGPEAELVKARMELFAPIFAVGVSLGLAGVYKATNGGFNNTSALEGGPPNRIQIGNAYFEVSRFDPISLTVAMGGLVGQATRQGFADGTAYDAAEGAKGAMQTAFAAAHDSILSKSYLTGLRDIVAAVASPDSKRAIGAVQKVLQNSAARMVPLAGTSRTLTESFRFSAPEAMTTADAILRGIPGASLYLPTKRDVLGNPVDGRTMGIAIGSSAPSDDVAAELQRLGLSVQNLRATDPSGFTVSAANLDELRRVRGHEALDSQGRTLPEALRELFSSGPFQTAATRAVRERMVSSTISSFNEPARELLEERNPQFAADRSGNKAFREFLEQGFSKQQSREQARQTTADLGLPEPNIQ